AIADQDKLGTVAAVLAEHRPELQAWLYKVLRATLFSQGSSVLRAGQQDKIITGVMSAFFTFLQNGTGSEVTAQGEKCASQGVAEQALLDFGTTLNQFCLDHLTDDLLRIGLMAADRYHKALLHGFMVSREALVLSAQEEIREVLQLTLNRRSIQLQTAAEISSVTALSLSTEEILERSVDLIRDRFDFYYVGLFLLDDLAEYAVLRAGTGEAGRQMLAAAHKLAAGESSMIGWCVTHREARIALNVGMEAIRFDNPFLPQTRSEMALPLIAPHGIIGAMTVQSEITAAFSEADITVLQTVANQLANAIANARSFTREQARYEELRNLQRTQTGQQWEKYRRAKAIFGYTYDLSRLEPLDAPFMADEAVDLPQIEIAAQVYRDEVNSWVTTPITLHDEPIGMFRFEGAAKDEISWGEDELEIVAAVRDQVALALENRLLFERTDEALTDTRNLYNLGRQINASQTTRDILTTLAQGLKPRLELERVDVGLLEPTSSPQELHVITSWSREGTAAQPGDRYLLERWQRIVDMVTSEGKFVTADVEQSQLLDEASLQVYRRMGIRGLVAYRLEARDTAYGIVLMYTKKPHAFAQEELEFYEAVTRTASVALENQLLLETTRAEAERRAFLNKVVTAASASLDASDLMHDVGQIISQHLNMPILLWRWDGQQVYPVVAYYDDGRELAVEELGLRLIEMPGIGAAIRWKRSLLWDFTKRSQAGHVYFMQLLSRLQLKESFSVPLMVRNEILGLITLGCQVGHPAIDASERVLLESIAVSMGVALENANLYRESLEIAEQLKEVDRLKSEFLANMSHELRTPLNSIIGFSRVILKGIDGPLNDMQRTDLSAIHESGKHLLNLINDILDLSKIEAGKMEFFFELVDLAKVASGVLSTAVALVKDKPIELQRDFPVDFPLVQADERRIRQVILNVVGNAAKFTEEGFISISGERKGKDEVVIAIADSGIGIPKDKYDTVFSEFQQVDSSSTRSYGGTGLGLPVSKKFVEAHGGRIWFESEIDVGTIFYMALPIAGLTAEQLAERAEEEAAESTIEERVVLMVDDDERVITLFRRYLEQDGYRVMALTHGEMVVAEAKRIQPYAITLDILLPDKDGWQIIQELKSDPETANIPILVCSIVSDADKGLSLGVTDYLVKPIVAENLLESLDRLTRVVEAYNILIVDDSESDRNLLRRILEEAGYAVREAAGGAAALVGIHAELPDLVVLDLMMPEVDGFTVLENIRANEVTKHIPVIVVTAKELTAAEHEQLNLQAAALLEKGIFDQQQLLVDVKRALEQLAGSTISS
ncbi:MAG: response regulator, partial [Anaerolineae bacterium]|nr:response regulator [Anaerolineae bacterium]